MCDLVGNPEDKFSHGVAHFLPYNCPCNVVYLKMFIHISSYFVFQPHSPYLELPHPPGWWVTVELNNSETDDENKANIAGVHSMAP